MLGSFVVALSYLICKACDLTADLEHLGRQGRLQAVAGPIQDDEALLLFATIRVTGVRRVLEVGADKGDSAFNFLAALRCATAARLYSVDTKPVKAMGPRHTTISKDAANLTWSDIDYNPVDLLFLDCHHYGSTKRLVQRVLSQKMLRSDGMVALHDTGLHSWQRHPSPKGEKPVTIGNKTLYVHQPTERIIAQWLPRYDPEATWQRISFHHDRRRPYRHGLTLMQRRVNLRVENCDDWSPSFGLSQRDCADQGHGNPLQ
mmetsp:Transcript_151004/g.266454  ORF Transcript_151004/g.266454 Transcript_151004/m.266454 type:complete len:260 (-) Transcript_151004:58-837(-)